MAADSIYKSLGGTYDNQMICGFYMFTRLPKTFPIFSDVQSSPWPPFSGLTPNIPPVEGYTKTCPAPQTPQFATPKKAETILTWRKSSPPIYSWGAKEKYLQKLIYIYTS